MLDGQSAGQAWVDTLFSQNSGIIREAAFGCLYFGEALGAAAINDMISGFDDEGDVFIGLWPDDDLWGRLRRNPGYVAPMSGLAIAWPAEPFTFTGASAGGVSITRVASDLFKCSMMARYLISVFGSPKKALQRGTWLSLMKGRELLSAGSAGPSANGLLDTRMATTVRTIHKLSTSGNTRLGHYVVDVRERLGLRPGQNKTYPAVQNRRQFVDQLWLLLPQFPR